MDMEQYLDIFIEESKEHLQNLNESTLELENDTENEGLINEVFRIAHTLKGMAGTMGFTKMQKLTHDMENVLSEIRNGNFKLTSDIVDVLFKCLDALEAYTEEIATTGSEGDENYTELLEVLADIYENGTISSKTEVAAAVEQVVEPVKEDEDLGYVKKYNNILLDTYHKNIMYKAIEQGLNVYGLTVYISPKCVLKSARAFVIFKALEDCGEIIKIVPDVQEIEDENFDQDLSLIILTAEKKEKLHDTISAISEVDKVLIDNIQLEQEEQDYEKKYEQISLDSYQRSTISKAKDQGFNIYGLTVYISTKCVLKSARAFVIFKALEEKGEIIKTVPEVQDIEDEKFDYDLTLFILTKESKESIKESISSLNEVDQVLIDDVAISEHTEEIKEEKEETKKEVRKEAKEKPKTTKTVRVDIERLDTLMNLVSELIIIKNSLENIEGLKGDNSFNESVEYLERITTNLHDAVMKVRMVPVEQVFNRFPRMIRDLSRKLNKEIQLEMSGKETELDRTVIDEIGDPLLHLLRNAADHGLETPEERIKAGKSEVGNVFLTAYQDGNNVIIEVKDDGKGINVEKIKNKAISNGIISAAEAENLKKEQILDFLFMPSFSTASEVTDVSGRGVGLDVVKTKIQSLGGSIDIKTVLNEGSTFTIRLPLTLAIIQALMVSVGPEKYAIPLNTIQTIERVNVSDIKYVQNNEVIILRDKVIPILRLDDTLEVSKLKIEEEAHTVVIVKKGEKLAGFVVDDLIGQQEIVIKSLGKYLSNIKLIAGATILGDGEVALILDVNTLI